MPVGPVVCGCFRTAKDELGTADRMKSWICLLSSVLLLSAAAAAQSPYGDPGQVDNGTQSEPCTQDMQTQGLCSPQNLQQNYQNGTPAYPNAARGYQTQQTTGTPNPLSQYPGYEGEQEQPSSNSSQLQQRRIPFPPEPLTAFQKFVASTTREVLPVYGASLFRDVPSTFAPLNQGPVPATYVLGPGDQIRVRVWGQVNFTTLVTVDRSGGIYLPQIGEVHVEGVPVAALEDVLRNATRQVFRNFQLTATLGQTRSIQVYVVGQARRPGVYTISSLSTLVDALFSSGGPSADGSMRQIEVRRGGQTLTKFDLYDLLLRGDKSKDVPLLSGDVIFIPPVGPQAAIFGSVRTQAIYELKPGQTLADLIADAGGASAIAAESRISIERVIDHKDRAAMEVGFDTAGLATSVHDGDLVQVLSIVPAYQKTVTLRGNTANPGRFAWHAGMRLSDLIPDRQSLITRNYWWRRTQLGLPSPEFEPLQDYPQLTQPRNPVELNQRREAEGQQMAQPGVGPYQQIPTQQNNSFSAQQDVNGQQQQQPVDGMNPQFDRTQQGGQYGQYGQNRQNDRSKSSSLAAQVEVRTENTSGALPPLQVKVPAPDIDWSYAVIERLDAKTLKTTLVPFDLGRLVLDHDEAQNLELEPGDVVSIFSQGDLHVPLSQQTKYVRLEGEFVHAGVYSVQPGETLRQLVERAGGLTSDAYLYGSEFTRESTRVLQQRRMDEYIQNLEAEIQRASVDQARGGVASATQIAAASAATTSEENMLSRLEQVRATGRIVLELAPNSKGAYTLPDIPLEDGDRLVVPSIPSSINVVGAVYDQNSFLFKQERRSGEYLHLAGGPNRDADRRHAFIIRADGSVVSREMTNTLFGNDFEALRMNPGDTIVVPDKVYRPGTLQNFLDYTQIFSQLAVGAATVGIVY